MTASEEGIFKEVTEVRVGADSAQWFLRALPVSRPYTADPSGKVSPGCAPDPGAR